MRLRVPDLFPIAMISTPSIAGDPRTPGGFTLLEMIVVCGVLAVLFGLGVGYLGRTDPMAVADSVLQGELRAARFTARAEGLPTEVLVRPGTDEAPVATVRARLLEPLTAFSFEPGEPVLDESLRGEYGGEDVRGGRFGHARRNDPDDDRPVVRWAASPDVCDLREGFALRLDVRLDERRSCTVWRLGGVAELRLDELGRPRARLRLTGGTALASATATLESPAGLPLHRWVTLDLACDGAACWITLDGRELARAAVDGSPLQDESDVLEVSPSENPVPGLLDEVRVFAYAFGPAQLVPSDLQPDRAYRIAFDARGEPLTSTDVRWVSAKELP